MSEHAILSPSSAARRVACPGSRALEALYPQSQDSEFAREGTAAHWVASEMLLAAFGFNRVTTLDEFAPNGEIITQEMIDGAILYRDAIKEIYDPQYAMHIEKKIDISVIHPDCWGTPDCWFVKGTELHVFDYKYGHGFVEVFENWQLIEYACGIFYALQDKPLSIHLHIVQPRSFHKNGPVRSWLVLADNLRDYTSFLKDAENAATQKYTQLRPTSECTYCSARHACVALQESALRSTDLTLSNIDHNLPASGVGSELRYLKRAAKLLDARITGLEEQALSKIKNGERVPFFRVEETAGRKRWIKSAEEIITLGEMLCLNLAKPREAITPIQALKSGAPEDLVREFSETPRGSLKLVEDNARKMFGDC